MKNNDYMEKIIETKHIKLSIQTVDQHRAYIEYAKCREESLNHEVSHQLILYLIPHQMSNDQQYDAPFHYACRFY